jgi:hypothetical protein
MKEYPISVFAPSMRPSADCLLGHRRFDRHSHAVDYYSVLCHPWNEVSLFSCKLGRTVCITYPPGKALTCYPRPATQDRPSSPSSTGPVGDVTRAYRRVGARSSAGSMRLATPSSDSAPRHSRGHVRQFVDRLFCCNGQSRSCISRSYDRVTSTSRRVIWAGIILETRPPGRRPGRQVWDGHGMAIWPRPGRVKGSNRCRGARVDAGSVHEWALTVLSYFRYWTVLDATATETS